MKIYINGKFYSKADAVVSVYDHGLLYGDGVFEGIRAYGGRIFKLREHIDRLYESAKSIMLKMPITKNKLMEEIIRTVRANGLKDAYIRLVVTRGIGKLGLNPFHCGKPQIIIIADKIVLYPKAFYEKGLSVVTVPTQRNIAEAVNPRIKSLNYLNNILAKIEACNAGVHEAIMLNASGYVAECTGDNIFIVKKGVLKTPPLYMGILEGITRDEIIRLARQFGIEVMETILTRHDIFNADECFLTGTAAELIPVVKVDERVVGTGKPGAVTRKLTAAFHELVRRVGVAV
ncbi:MAG: branched-chain-amino-acid transaminase [Candidatus Aureabacteria bacterium]|nr:branched-chain-amino-acid transaminase [Candidatus Auribacterota bacterium]